MLPEAHMFRDRRHAEAETAKAEVLDFVPRKQMQEKKSKQTPELTWPGKDDRRFPVPMALVEDASKSHRGAVRSDGEILDNMLVHGDNLPVLLALERDFAEKVKCVCIDPPYNTGATLANYGDGMEHSAWLSAMRDRLEAARRLLSPDGAAFVILDDSESAYCKVLMDEVFGRGSYVNEVIHVTYKAFGFKGMSSRLFRHANHILLYAKDRKKLSLNPLFVEKEYDPQYRFVFENTDGDEGEWTWRRITDVVAERAGFANPREAKKALGDSGFAEKVAAYALENASRVFRTASVTGGALQKRRDTIAASKLAKDRILRHSGDDMDYMFIGGERVIFYKERLHDIGGRMLPGEPVTDVWTDIPVEGLAKEGGVYFPNGKKPERLIARCLTLVTRPGDLVLDFFLGSGTTAAVAHKMGRRWIGVELGDHCYTHCKARLDRVVDGKDWRGITKAVGWKGGGGYRFFELAPTSA